MYKQRTPGVESSIFPVSKRQPRSTLIIWSNSKKDSIRNKLNRTASFLEQPQTSVAEMVAKSISQCSLTRFPLHHPSHPMPSPCTQLSSTTTTVASSSAIILRIGPSDPLRVRYSDHRSCGMRARTPGSMRPSIRKMRGEPRVRQQLIRNVITLVISSATHALFASSQFWPNPAQNVRNAVFRRYVRTDSIWTRRLYCVADMMRTRRCSRLPGGPFRVG